MGSRTRGGWEEPMRGISTGAALDQESRSVPVGLNTTAPTPGTTATVTQTNAAGEWFLLGPPGGLVLNRTAEQRSVWVPRSPDTHVSQLQGPLGGVPSLTSEVDGTGLQVWLHRTSVVHWRLRGVRGSEKRCCDHWMSLFLLPNVELMLSCTCAGKKIQGCWSTKTTCQSVRWWLVTRAEPALRPS